ncbi:MAG: hypothetical protein ACFFBD_23575, partial [Candidatus Hodarchaeota archaeon]
DIIYSPPPQIGKTFLVGKEMNWWGNALKVMLTRIKPFLTTKYDIVLLDNQNGISANSSNNVVMSDIGILVLRPISYGVTGTIHTFKELYTKLKGFPSGTERKTFLIWNQIPRDPGNKELSASADAIIDRWDAVFRQTGLTPIARIDLNPSFALRMLTIPQNSLLGIFPEIQKKLELICTGMELI